MAIEFLDRREEMQRIGRHLGSKNSSLLCLYGRRRLGKTRLIREAISGRPAVLCMGDDREAALQRRSVAREIARQHRGFDNVEYPDWDALMERWDEIAGPGHILVLDEFPSMVGASPELPAVIQKFVDRQHESPRHVIIAGSSQRMMLGMLLDASAPLYGRAKELLKVEPLEAGWISKALGLPDARSAVEHYSVWGGVPRYWELARGFGLDDAVVDLVLSPLGVLHREPERLLRDDLRDTRQAASILSLIGQGCHRLSEIAARLQKPSTSLSRPMKVLIDMGLVHREMPFGQSPRSSKRTLYVIADPFLGFWFKLVDTNRSRLEAGQAEFVWNESIDEFRRHVAWTWENLVRRSIARAEIESTRWEPGSRWWGNGTDGKMIELDVVSQSTGDPDRLLVGEVKLSCRRNEASRLLHGLEKKAANLPFAEGKRVDLRLWVLKNPQPSKGGQTIGPDKVIEALSGQ